MRWDGYTDDWPEGFRPCSKCGEMKSYDEYHKSKRGIDGRMPECKKCRNKKSKREYSKQSLKELLYHRAKSRATVKGWEFDLEMEDIIIPELCPVFKVPMVRGTPTAASLDRIDSSKGYVKDNIQVISRKANSMKSNATFEEVKMLYEFMADGCVIT